ncbi:putative F-box domain-containing protein [Helianthus annuus]|nr:putative F-box domain-containing protein [Helianthus annuus]
MSDCLPYVVEAEIMMRLPVKSLLQFRSVSKAWKSLIDHSDFTARYRGQHHHHLLVRYNDTVTCNENYVSIVDDHTFPQQKVSLPIPQLGLFCFYGDDQAAVLWNPAIRKEVTVVVPAREGIYETVLGYGVCRETADPKIVKIRYITREENTESFISCIPWQVEVCPNSVRFFC